MAGCSLLLFHPATGGNVRFIQEVSEENVILPQGYTTYVTEHSNTDDGDIRLLSTPVPVLLQDIN